MTLNDFLDIVYYEKGRLRDPVFYRISEGIFQNISVYNTILIYIYIYTSAAQTAMPVHLPTEDLIRHWTAKGIH